MKYDVSMKITIYGETHTIPEWASLYELYPSTIRARYKEGDFIHNDKEITVPIEQVAKNNYNLSVSSYIDETPPREKIDGEKINADVRQSTLELLQSTLKMGEIVCDLSGKSVKPFIDDLRKVIDDFEMSAV